MSQLPDVDYQVRANAVKAAYAKRDAAIADANRLASAIIKLINAYEGPGGLGDSAIAQRRLAWANACDALSEHNKAQK